MKRAAAVCVPDLRQRTRMPPCWRLASTGAEYAPIQRDGKRSGAVRPQTMAQAHRGCAVAVIAKFGNFVRQTDITNISFNAGWEIRGIAKFSNFVRETDSAADSQIEIRKK